jgi:hypothetical protein
MDQKLREISQSGRSGPRYPEQIGHGSPHGGISRGTTWTIPRRAKPCHFSA